jgi:hypothetical protein
MKKHADTQTPWICFWDSENFVSVLPHFALIGSGSICIQSGIFFLTYTKRDMLKPFKTVIIMIEL